MPGATDEEMERWLSLSDEEQDKLLRTQLEEFCEWFAALSPLEQYRWRRAKTLETIQSYRKLIQEHGMDFLTVQLHRARTRLVTHRQIYYSNYTCRYHQ